MSHIKILDKHHKDLLDKRERKASLMKSLSGEQLLAVEQYCIAADVMSRLVGDWEYMNLTLPWSHIERDVVAEQQLRNIDNGFKPLQKGE